MLLCSTKTEVQGNEVEGLGPMILGLMIKVLGMPGVNGQGLPLWWLPSQEKHLPWPQMLPRPPRCYQCTL